MRCRIKSQLCCRTRSHRRKSLAYVERLSILNPKFEPTTGRVYGYTERRAGFMHCCQHWEVDSFKERYYLLPRIYSPRFEFAGINWQVHLQTARKKLRVVLCGKTKYNRVLCYDDRKKFKYNITFASQNKKMNREFEGDDEFFGKYFAIGAHRIKVKKTLPFYPEKTPVLISVNITKVKVPKSSW